MNHTTALLFIGLAFVLGGPISQAQAPSPVPSGSHGADTPRPAPQEEPVNTTQPSDTPESANTIRIVRLAQTSGKTEMDRNIGLGFETAFNNLPVTEGARLKTSEGSAEVEYEDGTTLRLTPDTQVDFTQLSRAGSGATLSSMNVLRGTVYLSLSKDKGNTFRLTSGDGVVNPRPGAHLRLEVKDPESRLSVITGKADFTNTAGSQEVGKMKSLIFNTATHSPADLIVGIEDAPFDSWDEQQAEYHHRYSRGNALVGSGVTYGLADLNYYGAFTNVGGCGTMWRPYFASAAWDPYATGIWVWYPGSGYSWVSPYPWAWAPFHYGSWLQCGGGWGWQPGGGWYGLGGVGGPHRFTDGNHHPIHAHPIPPRPPRPGTGTPHSMVAVNLKPLAFSHFDRATTSFNFVADSAGLGVPRGAFGKLNKLSAAADKTGSSAVPLFLPANRTDRPPIPSGSVAARRDGASQARIGEHQGFFNRPGNQSLNGHNTYAERGAGNLSDAQRANRSATLQGAVSPGTVAGYSGANRGTNGGYTASPRGGNGGTSGYAAGSSGYSGGSRSAGRGGQYSAGGGGYSSGSHPRGGSYSGGGGGGYSGGSHSGGGGFSNGGGGYSGGGGGGAHASAPGPSAPSAPASAPSAPAPSAPSPHR